MTKTIVVITILALSTSGALAAQKHKTHHHQGAMNAYARMGAPPAYGSVAAPPFVGMGGVSSSDRGTYMKNLHDSGYNPKNDFNSNGTIRAD